MDRKEEKTKSKQEEGYEENWWGQGYGERPLPAWALAMDLSGATSGVLVVGFGHCVWELYSAEESFPTCWEQLRSLRLPSSLGEVPVVSSMMSIADVG